MYTQCPDCSTVFRVTAEALRAAQGRVRCGICSSGFDALENLSESPVARALDEDSHEDTITVEELPGNEFIELSGVGESVEDQRDRLVEAATARPDDLAEQIEDQPDDLAEQIEDQPDGLATGMEELLDEEPSDEGTGEGPDALDEERPPADQLEDLPDAALEFHGSAEDLEWLFVPAGLQSPGTAPAPAELPQAMDDIASRDLSGIEVREEDLSWPDDGGSSFDPGNPAHVAAVLASASGATARDVTADLDRTDEYPVLVIEDDGTAPAGDGEVHEPQGDESPALPVETAGAGPDEAASSGHTAAADVPREAGETTGDAPYDQPPDETPLLIIPEELRHGPSATAADELAAPLDLEEEGPRRWPLAVAAALLAAALGVQAVHYWRQDLVRSPAAGPWMLRAYHALGLELQPPVDLGRFELRQLGAASDPGQAGRIRVRASIVNHAPFAQPYPLLRLTLQDRFGSTIGARNLGPAEYLPSGAVDASGLLGASQRADAEVVFVDPGREAVGFELDVCTEGDSGLRCSADLPRSAP